MSFVQGVGFGTSSTSGNPAGNSITGVGAGHGLPSFLWFNGTTTPGITSITDSAGTTWAVSGSPVAMVSGGTSIVCVVPTSAVVAGTHTLTANYTGGGSYWVMYIEDTLNTLRAAAIGRNIPTPGAGQTLTPGSAVGNSGDLVYLFAFDDITAAAPNQPVAGSGGFTIPAALTGTITFGGSYSAGYNASAGGTTPSFAPGTAGASDETGVISFALIAAASPTATVAWIT
jgi:hypothetical protein